MRLEFGTIKLRFTSLADLKNSVKSFTMWGLTAGSRNTVLWKMREPKNRRREQLIPETLYLRKLECQRRQKEQLVPEIPYMRTFSAAFCTQSSK